jgi:hypothetical protein
MTTLAKRGLTIRYDGPVNRRMEKAVTDLLLLLGYEWWASGYNLVDGVRDLSYDEIGNDTADTDNPS